MSNILPVLPLFALIAVGLVGFGVQQWSANRKPSGPSADRINRATFTLVEKQHAKEWMGN